MGSSRIKLLLLCVFTLFFVGNAAFSLAGVYKVMSEVLSPVIESFSNILPPEKEVSHVPEQSGADKSFTVSFINDSTQRTSIWWMVDEDVTRVVNSLAPKDQISLQTFYGHNFVFTREGTRDQVGPIFTATKSGEIFKLDDKLIKDNEGDGCKDRSPGKCQNWVAHGECDKNPGWMIVNCPKSCDKCELLDTAKRCDPNFLNTSAEHIWAKGDLNKMFNKILSNKQWVEEFSISKIPVNPDTWLLQFDSFLTDAEVDVLIDWGVKLGFQRSTDTGKENDRGEVTKVFSTGRTSTNAWCTNDCENDPVVQNISQRIVNLTGVPYENYEQFQLLRYEEGQHYKVHHDMGPPKYIPNTDTILGGGVRILTFFLYLNDVELGGETEFPPLSVKVSPKKGRAILWPSVLDSNPLKQDKTTFHAALPVGKGLKFAANHWIHSHDFKTANKWGCTGAFD